MKIKISFFGIAALVLPVASGISANTTVGKDVGSNWTGIPKIDKAVALNPPPVIGTTQTPNYSMYPVAAGAKRGAFTKNYLQDFSLGGRPRLRSWMGWFAWADGKMPLGINPGIYATADGYGKYNGADWDFFNFQWPKSAGREGGAWNPIRLDQQPLYLTPLVLNYNWAPALFGYESAPLSNFPLNTFYMGGRWQAKDDQTPKKIVRGINIGGSIPFFYQYGDRLSAPIPPSWRQSWLYLATRPLETTVIVPSNVQPSLLAAKDNIPDDKWVPITKGKKDPFPYPVWRTASGPREQTPYAILIDKMGDFHADLIWEATNSDEANYDTFRYKRTPFSKVEKKQPVGTGDYLKMTVAQGSPFVWCEMNNSAYAIFYNLIRTNLPFQINNNKVTGARTLVEGPLEVPGTKGVQYVLLYGDHVNPNQWFQESEPLYARSGDGPNDSNQPGGFNPPPLSGTYRDKNDKLISTAGQHNYVYTAIFFRTDTVDPVRLSESGDANNGTDAQGNPYFYLKFKNATGKNWFVVGSVPEMRYYGVSQDSAASRLIQAKKWAENMGKHAFNFVTDTKIAYTVKNMNRTETTYTAQTANPFAELPLNIRPINADRMTKKGTVLALQPHQYQPITLGPDYTKANKPQVVWNPLQGNLEPLATPQNLNANKNTKSDLKVWDYWSIKGSLRSYVIPDSFTTAYPFQNFLPVMPAPKFERTFKQTGIAAVNIVNTGTGYKKINKVPTVTIKTGTNPQIPGTGAGAKALIDDNTSQVLQVDVVSPGNDYPNGLPPKGVTVEIEPPVAGTQATAYPQTGGGSLLAVFMINKGSGYSSIINVDQKGLDNVIDPPVILPNFDKDGNLLAGPAIIRESGAGFNFSTTTQPVAQLFTGSGSGAVLQVVQPGTIYKYGVPITGGGVAGGYPSSSAQGNPPDYVKVHVQPPPSGGPAQEATASFSRISGVGSPPIAITNPGLYSNVAGVYATYKNSQGTESSRLPVTFEPSGSNYKVKGVEGASLPVDVPTALTFHGGTVVTKPVAQINPYYSLKAIATQVGSYTGTDNFSASFVDDAGSTIRLLTSWSQTDGKFYISDIAAPSAYLTKPKTAQITGGSFSQQAEITVFPVWFVSQVISGSNIATGYNKDAQVSFTGNSFSTDADIRVPNLTFKIPGTPGNRNVIAPSDIKIVDGGKGLFSGRPIDFLIEGGRGLDAILDPVIVSGTLSAVRVIQNGNNYLPNVIAQISHGGGTGAQVKVNVLGSTNYISSVTVTNGGSGYTHAPTITLLSGKPTDNAAPDPVIWENPKGVPAVFTASVTNGSISKIEKLPVPPNRPNPIYARYYAGSENTATTKSTPSSLVYRGTPQFSTYTSASLWYATPAPDETEVEQVLYSSLISTYAKLSSASLAPFGGAYLGDAAPDGYGLGGQISGAAKFVGDIYNMQQKYKTIPKAIPLDYATAAGKAPFAAGDNTWEFRVQQENNPYFTLSGALKTSVQSLQRSLSMLFMEPPSHNNPSEIFKSTTWKMDYFSQIDSGVGRIIINPTATQPAWGINSSTQTPGDLTSLNDGKTGLSKWNKGMLWSGFGVSDQWNDQHYFYGYYLSSAALAGLLDRAWEDTPGRRGGAPDKLWASKEEMGAGMDQLLLTLAYDPDSKDLQDPNTGYYRIPSLEYQKLAFFDQWSGQPWATGAMPGSTVATLDFEKDPFAYWRSFGTDSDKFDGENENSIFEGIQAWSAAILWGGATDRKSVVDLGIYLYSTNLAAADSYFLDKNYNLVNSSLNKHSWVPVTTIDASLVAKNGNNDDLPYPSGQTGPRWPAGTDYASASPVAYYTAPEFFGDENGTTISPGQSLMKKSASTLNNFFYAFPTGSKFIQAYPPTSWTLGMARNTTYMKKWAGAMMRQEWNDARNSALYQPADWLGLAMTSALAGVPYNPGDVPYPLTGKTPSAKKVDKYLNRLWSSWVTPYDAPGSNASRTPPFLAHSILTFLLALDDYGVPDWTYIGVATGPAGGEDPKSVVFTAVFTKEPQPGDTSVTTTFVAFNPGWETRHAKFQRLDKDGEVTKGNISGTLMIKPKETVLKTMSFSIGTGAPLATGPTATAEDDQTRLERLKELLKNN